MGPQGLLATKARVLVTNGISYLKYFDQLVYLRRGMILESGSYGELMSNPDSEVRKLVCVYFHSRCSTQSNRVMTVTAMPRAVPILEPPRPDGPAA